MNNNNANEGYLYIITNPAMPGWVKIGVTEDLNNRLHNYQTGDPNRSYKIEYYLKHPEYKIAEKKIKENMKMFAKSIKNEWFECSLLIAKTRLDEVLDDYNNGLF